MSAITRAKALIEALKDSTVANAMALKIVDGYLTGKSVDITDMTNEVKAQSFLDTIKTDMKGYYRHAAYINAAESNQAVVDAALVSADNDFR